MADYIRRIVSGNKARFRDESLKLELDLVYVTDQIIIMGYPASGIEGLYRNRREDAIRFLEHRHGKNYWVFNFCPIQENSYEAAVFEGRVSRYPFPDHHAPPLAIMPLVAREMRAWLKGSADRVAVLHCKAGKGRSGTMACAYLLSIDEGLASPLIKRNYSTKQWAAQRMENTLSTLPPDEEQQQPSSSNPGLPLQEQKTLHEADIPDADSGSLATSATSSPNHDKSFADALQGALDLHTARRMKPSSEKESKAKQGVSIPSQRRFLYYWTLLLANEGPKHMWSVDHPLTTKEGDQEIPPLKRSEARQKVRLTQLTLRMRETSIMKMSMVKFFSRVIERTNMAKGPSAGVPVSLSPKEKENASLVWASLARYDDHLVDLLEEWEVYTRDRDGHLGKRRPGSDHLVRGESTEEQVLSQVFGNGKWDGGKMVKTFAHLGAVNGAASKVVEDDKDGEIYVYHLRPLSNQRWEDLRQEISADNLEGSSPQFSRANSMDDANSTSRGPNPGFPEQGVLLDAGREVRIKLYLGQVFMGWLWFIPTFHMPQPTPSSPPTSSNHASATSKLVLTRKELDFPIGLGNAIVDVEIDMEWVVPSQPSHPPVTSGGTGGPGIPVQSSSEGNAVDVRDAIVAEK